MKTLLLTLTLIAGSTIARADVYNISATLPGGVTGTGSFTTAGSCLSGCSKNSGLTAFTFTVDDDAFTLSTPGPITFFSSDNTLNGFLIGADSLSDMITFASPNSVIFEDATPTFVHLQGTYTVTRATAAVPEPTSLALFGTALLGVGLKLRRRKISA